MISISKAANYLGVSIPTLRRWEKKGYIKAYRTIGNHRRYEISDLDNIYNRNKVNINEKRNHDEIKIAAAAIYARVSTIDQKQHGDLERQIDTLIKYAEDNNFKIQSIYKDVGSGLNGKRKSLLRLMEGARNKLFS